ncbi:hypothetical protein Tco_0676602 [Tanacetum coccineum]
MHDPKRDKGKPVCSGLEKEQRKDIKNRRKIMVNYKFKADGRISSKTIRGRIARPCDVDACVAGYRARDRGEK